MSALDRIAAELRRSLDGIDPAELDAARELIRAVPGAITTTGQGRSGLVAAMIAMRLMHLGLRAHVAAEATAPAVTADDLLLVVSGSGTTPVSLGFARIARDVGARVLVVTRVPDSPLAGLADATVRIPGSKPSEQPGGSLFEQSALLALDAVVLELADATPGAAELLRSRHTNLL